MSSLSTWFDVSASVIPPSTLSRYRLQRILQRPALWAFALVLLLLCPFAAFGQTLHATLSNFTVDEQPTWTINGSFDYNPLTGKITGLAINANNPSCCTLPPVFIGDAPDSNTNTQSITPPYFAINLVKAPNGHTCENSVYCGTSYIILTLPSLPTSPGTYAVGCVPIPGCGGAPWASQFFFPVTSGGNNGYAANGISGGSLIITDGGKALGAGSPGQVCCGDPVNPATGNMYMQVTDYETAGQNKLSVIRYYNSQGASTGSFATTLGPVWRTNFDRYLRINSSTAVTAERADGRQVNFTYNGTSWTTDSDVDITLTNSGTTWTLTDHDDTKETYTTTSAGNEALLNSIEARNGYTQTLAYGTNGFVSTVTDSYNRTLTFTYQSGLLFTITTPESQNLEYIVSGTGGPSPSLTEVQFATSPTTHVTYVYNQTGFPYAITSLTDENNNTYSTWTYDAVGRAASSQFGSGANLMTFAYNGDGTTTVTNALGVADTYTFTTLQNVPKVTQISRAATATTAAATESFAYDGNGYQNSVTDWNGNQTTYANNGHGQPTTINEAVGSSVARTTTIAYDSTFVHLPDSITTPGLTTSFTYDGSGDVLTKTLTDTTTQSIPYSTNGQTRTWTNTWSNFLLASVKNPNNNTTTFGYDSTGALTSVTDAKSHVTNITSHTGGGLPETIVDPNGATNGTTTTLSYDPRQRLTSKAVASSAGTHTTTYTLDAAGNLTKITLPDNSYVAYVYDTAHRVTKATNALGEYQTYTLDALGDRTQVNTYDSSNALWRQQAQTFDALGRQLTYVGGGGLDTTTYTYDKNGNALTVKDGNNHTTTRVFDALNRLSTSTDANSGVTQFAYDAHDRTTSATDANSHATAYVFDGFGDNIQIASPDTGTSVYHYDADANLTQKVDGAGVTANLSYDALDRVTSRTYPADSTPNAYFHYDQPGGSGSPLSNNEIGRLSYVDEATGHVYFAYDPFGNVSHRERANTSYTDINDIWIAYDAANRVTGVSYPSGLWVAQNRDAAGQVDNVNIVPPGAPNGTNVDWTAYAPFFGPLRYETSGNNMRDVKSPDQDYRTGAFAIQSNGGSTNLINETLTYDAANNLTGVADSVNAFNNQTLGYDVINRLTSAASGSGGYGSLAWTYDKVGNLLSQTVNSSTATYGYASGTNRLASITNGGTATVTTNGNGNITSIPPANSGTAATFAYNAASQLVSVTGSPLGETLVYDAFGQRYSKQDPGSNPTVYTYDLDGNMIEENDNGAITDYLYNNGVLVGLWLPGTSKLYYVHTNQQGTPLMATDSSSNIVWNTTYQPYGTTGLITGSITQNVRLPGQLFDVETGFSYNRFRDYMPNLGRYLEADPIGLHGGINPYRYARANPLKYTDRIGLQEAEPDEEDPLAENGNPTQQAIGGRSLIDPNQEPDPDPYDPDPSPTEEEILEQNRNATADRCFPPQTPMGRRGNPLNSASGNAPANINGVNYTDHALDQMMGRGITPSVVENTLIMGTPSSVNNNRTAYTDPNNGVQVIVEADGTVVTVKTVGRQ